MAMKAVGPILRSDPDGTCTPGSMDDLLRVLDPAGPRGEPRGAEEDDLHSRIIPKPRGRLTGERGACYGVFSRGEIRAGG